MFDIILKSLKEMFMPVRSYDNLEAYIVAGNPQSHEDVEKLEREFMRLQRPMYDKYY